MKYTDAFPRGEPTDDGVALQLTRHTPEMWEKIAANLPFLKAKLEGDEA